jgi:hypothetical protein
MTLTTQFLWPVPTMSEHKTCLLVQVFLLLFLFVLWFHVILNSVYWFDWYETRRNTLYKTICSVSSSTGSCQYNGGIWNITPIFLYFVNFCISLSVCLQWADFLCCLNEESFQMRICSVTFIALVMFCIRVKEFNLKRYSKIHYVFYYLK